MVVTYVSKGKEGVSWWYPNNYNDNDDEGDFLGERQSKWFETAIRNSKASVNLIVNGLQVHPYRIPDADAHEAWVHFPTARQRLYDAVLQDGVQAPLLVSGDVHMAQLMRKDCKKRRRRRRGVVIGEDETWRYYYMHVMSKTIMTFVHLVLPMPDLMLSSMGGGSGAVVISVQT